MSIARMKELAGSSSLKAQAWVSTIVHYILMAAASSKTETQLCIPEVYQAGTVRLGRELGFGVVNKGNNNYKLVWEKDSKVGSISWQQIFSPKFISEIFQIAPDPRAIKMTKVCAFCAREVGLCSCERGPSPIIVEAKPCPFCGNDTHLPAGCMSKPANLPRSQLPEQRVHSDDAVMPAIISTTRNVKGEFLRKHFQSSSGDEKVLKDAKKLAEVLGFQTCEECNGVGGKPNPQGGNNSTKFEGCAHCLGKGGYFVIDKSGKCRLSGASVTVNKQCDCCGIVYHLSSARPDRREGDGDP